MKSGEIPVDPRHTARRIRAATQGNAVRALVELVTNSDDSYTRLEHQGIDSPGTIEIGYHKQGHRCLFWVRDHAEGMSLEELEKKFIWYGRAASGLKDGIGVRGYFGQGAQHALAGMLDGRVCTFKDGSFTECRLFLKRGKPFYELDPPVPADASLRERYGVPHNGTVAYFAADSHKTGHVPRFGTVQRELASNCQLRKIMTNRRRRRFLVNEDTGERRPLRYGYPSGAEVLQDDFLISYRRDKFPIRLTVMRASKVDLAQTGDDRTGGLLLLDEQDIVLGVSLFRYDTEPLAARLFGEVRIGNFRKLLRDEEPVLREERDGLVVRHPFCQSLTVEVEKRLKVVVNQERRRKQKEEQSKVDREEARRFSNAFRILNEIAEAEAPGTVNLGPKPTDEIDDPPDGFCLYPPTAQITVGKRYNFQLRVDWRKVVSRCPVSITCTSRKIRVLTKNIIIPRDVAEPIVTKHITVVGEEPDAEGVLRATCDGRSSESKVYVVPEKELLLSEGMLFQPESVTLRPNRPRKVQLFVYVKIVEGGNTISLSSDNPAVHLSRERITVNESDALRHMAKYEVEVWGEGDGEDACITAEWSGHMALLEVRVRSKPDEQPKGRKGMFNEPDYSDDTEPVQRTSYSRETGQVIVYVNFPSVRLYLGETAEFRKTLAAQVLIADLVAERCFHEIAKRKVETSGVVVRPQALPDRIQRDAFELSRKYGKKVHEALVNQRLLAESRSGAPATTQ